VIIGLDFDGTCVDHRFPGIGPEAPHCTHILNLLLAEGNTLNLNTMRGGKFLEEAQRWFIDKEVAIAGVNAHPGQSDWTTSPKVYAHVYVDDSGLGAPLIRPIGFHHPCIDWQAVWDMLQDYAPKKLYTIQGD